MGLCGSTKSKNSSKTNPEIQKEDEEEEIKSKEIRQNNNLVSTIKLKQKRNKEIKRESFKNFDLNGNQDNDNAKKKELPSEDQWIENLRVQRKSSLKQIEDSKNSIKGSNYSNPQGDVKVNEHGDELDRLEQKDLNGDDIKVNKMQTREQENKIINRLDDVENLPNDRKEFQRDRL